MERISSLISKLFNNLYSAKVNQSVKSNALIIARKRLLFVQDSYILFKYLNGESDPVVESSYKELRLKLIKQSVEEFDCQNNIDLVHKPLISVSIEESDENDPSPFHAPSLVI